MYFTVSLLGSPNYFTLIPHDVTDVNLKLLKEKVKGSDRDVSTVVLCVFLSRTFPFILLTGNCIFSRPADSCNFGVIEKLTRSCFFQIALETMLLPIIIVVYAQMRQ